MPRSSSLLFGHGVAVEGGVRVGFGVAVLVAAGTGVMVGVEVAGAGVADRVSVVNGSFFDPLPAGPDVCLLAHILHDWPDKEAVAVLRRCAEALEMAEALGVEELRAHSLATIGLAKVYLGDPTGAQDEVRALEMAMAVNSPVAGSIANNVAVHAFFAFEFQRAGELYEEGLRIAERLGDASGARWLRAQVCADGTEFPRAGGWSDNEDHHCGERAVVRLHQDVGARDAYEQAGVGAIL